MNDSRGGLRRMAPVLRLFWLEGSCGLMGFGHAALGEIHARGLRVWPVKIVYSLPCGHVACHQLAAMAAGGWMAVGACCLPLGVRGQCAFIVVVACRCHRRQPAAATFHAGSPRGWGCCMVVGAAVGWPGCAQHHNRPVGFVFRLTRWVPSGWCMDAASVEEMAHLGV